jgi:hypothetical protein
VSDEARRRELERLLRKMDEDAAVLEMRQETHPLSPKHLRWLAQLDRCRAQVRNMLAGQLPLDTYIPVEDGE